MVDEADHEIIVLDNVDSIEEESINKRLIITPKTRVNAKSLLDLSSASQRNGSNGSMENSDNSTSPEAKIGSTSSSADCPEVSSQNGHDSSNCARNGVVMDEDPHNIFDILLKTTANDGEPSSTTSPWLDDEVEPPTKRSRLENGTNGDDSSSEDLETGNSNEVSEIPKATSANCEECSKRKEQEKEDESDLNKFRKDMSAYASAKWKGACNCEKKMHELERQVTFWKDKVNRFYHQYTQLLSNVRAMGAKINNVREQKAADCRTVGLQVGLPGIPTKSARTTLNYEHPSTSPVRSLTPLPSPSMTRLPMLTRCRTPGNVAVDSSSPALQPLNRVQSGNSQSAATAHPPPLQGTPKVLINPMPNQAPGYPSVTISTVASKFVRNSNGVFVQQADHPGTKPDVLATALAAKKSIATVAPGQNGVRIPTTVRIPDFVANRIRIIQKTSPPRLTRAPNGPSTPLHRILNVSSASVVRVSKPMFVAAVPAGSMPMRPNSIGPIVSEIRHLSSTSSGWRDLKPVKLVSQSRDCPPLPCLQYCEVLPTPKESVPPKPDVTINLDGTNVTISWNMPESTALLKIYHLYSYQHGNPEKAWAAIGHIAALSLPMACSLGSLEPGYKYYFVLVAEDAYGRHGDFSEVHSVFLPILYNRA